MSYQTLPFFLHFNISSSSSSSSATPLPFPLSSSPISSQVETGMESVDISAAKAALKSSFQLEMAAAKATTQQQQQQQALVDDFWSGNGVVGGDDFVDEFLNFSNEDVAGFLREEREDVEEAEEEEEEEEEEKGWGLTSVSSPGGAQFVESSNSNSSNSDSSVSVIDDFGAQLDVPTDDLENLEWLSHFVEDSFSEFPSSSGSVAALGANSENPKASEKGKCEEASENGSKEEGAAGSGLTVETHVPGKARSKRSRTGNRVWSFHGPHLGESSSTTSSSSSSSSSSYSSSSSSPASCLIFENTGQNQDIFQCLGKPLCKRPKQNKGKKKPLAVSGNGQPQQPPQRRCSHCLVQKTPQWRTGPLGSKTLCNACGVRYKSGRLLPEYRPAGSPTFLSDVHSNNHRKVLEMRREKESTGPAALEPGLPAVHSF